MPEAIPRRVVTKEEAQAIFAGERRQAHKTPASILAARQRGKNIVAGADAKRKVEAARRTTIRAKAKHDISVNEAKSAGVMARKSHDVQAEAARSVEFARRRQEETAAFEQREVFRRSQQRIAAQGRSRNRVLGQSTANAINSVGAPQPVASVSQASASVGITGALFRMGAMALGLIVVYAVVTHAGPSAGAIGNTGAILQKFTASKPLFTKVG